MLKKNDYIIKCLDRKKDLSNFLSLIIMTFISNHYTSFSISIHPKCTAINRNFHITGNYKFLFH